MYEKCGCESKGCFTFQDNILNLWEYVILLNYLVHFMTAFIHFIAYFASFKSCVILGHKEEVDKSAAYRKSQQ